MGGVIVLAQSGGGAALDGMDTAFITLISVLVVSVISLSFYALKALRSDIQGVRSEIKDEIQGVRSDVKDDIKGIRSEIQGVRNEIQGVRNEIKDLRSDVKDDIKGVRSEIKENRDNIQDLRVDVNKLSVRADARGERLGARFDEAQRQQDDSDMPPRESGEAASVDDATSAGMEGSADDAASAANVETTPSESELDPLPSPA